MLNLFFNDFYQSDWHENKHKHAPDLSMNHSENLVQQ